MERISPTPGVARGTFSEWIAGERDGRIGGPLTLRGVHCSEQTQRDTQVACKTFHGLIGPASRRIVAEILHPARLVGLEERLDDPIQVALEQPG